MKMESDIFNSQAMEHYKKMKAMELGYTGKDPNLC
jgi:hypothetical protein